MSALIAAGIGAGASILGTAASVAASKAGQDRAGAAAGVAGQNSAMQNYIMAQQLRKQNELATATQTDTEGNQLVYDTATNSWIPLLSQRGLQVQAAGQSAQDIEREKYFGRGQWEDQNSFQRRAAAGGGARELMSVMRNQYGAPTKEGVEGTNKVYGVTAATEPADLIKSGASAAQLRTGGNATGLAAGFDAIDRKSAQGVRTALAAPQTGAFDEAFSKWVDPKLAQYKALDSSAAPPGQQPPGTGTEALNAQIAARATKPYQADPRVGYGSNEATKQMLTAMGGYKDTDYGTAFTGLGKQGIELYNAIRDYNKPPEITIKKTGSTSF